MPLSIPARLSALCVVQALARSTRPFAAAAKTACCTGISALMLTSCTTPQQPPSVDESTKRPVNARVAVELQACLGDLSRATLLVSEMAHASTMAAALNKAQPCPAAAVALIAESPAKPVSGNWVAVIPFGNGSAIWNVESEDAIALVRRANDAALIMIRGRTDATADSLQETALARRRALAASQFLQLAGVPGDKLRLTWQGAGDPMVGLQPTERAQSRRVEIEFYATVPTLVSLRSGAANGKGTPAASL